MDRYRQAVRRVIGGEYGGYLTSIPSTQKSIAGKEYGGKGTFTLPNDHKPLLDVPKGGSCCANCKYVNAEKHTCGEPNFILWNGGPKLPDKPLDELCSDWYTKG